MSSNRYPPIYLKSGTENRVKSGHLWIFSNEIENEFQRLPAGEIVSVFDHMRKWVGVGTINSQSLIAVRLLSYQYIELNEAFLGKRIEDAFRIRQLFFHEASNVCRIVNSESDGLPGLVIDRFGEVFVVQTLTAGMERLLPLILEILKRQFRPKAIFSANDAPIRQLEGLPLERRLLIGEHSGRVSFRLDGIHFVADVLNGQKTGFFLDQRENRRCIRQFIHQGDDVLDLFCYTGGFGLYALQAGARLVRFVDASESALEIAQETVQRNGWLDRSEFVKADIFPWINEHKEVYDMVILDPPPLAKSRKKVPEALRGYRELNARSLLRTKDLSIHITACCSGLVKDDSWKEVLSEASFKTRKNMQILVENGHPCDHPVLASMPETRYLKFIISLVSNRA